MDVSKLRVIHVDMDAFYASIEQRDHPEYRNRPVVVGGDPKGRGVVSAASYEARSFGIHSAMPCRRAAELCPKALFLPVDMKKYKSVSMDIHEIFTEYTKTIESISIDEAFLEIKEGNPIRVGKSIKKDILKKTGLTASVGVSYNKFMAKMASDMEKPDGFTVITPHRAKEVLPSLPMRSIWGVGEKTEKELKDLGIFTVRDFLSYDREFLLKNWGRRAYELLLLCQGIDNSEVDAHQEIKSMGEETTLGRDTKDREVLRKHLKEFSAAVSKRMAKAGIKCRTITVKAKYYDFQSITRGVTLKEPTDKASVIYGEASDILNHRVPLKKPIRLIGLQVSNLIYPDEPVQISFMDK